MKVSSGSGLKVGGRRQGRKGGNVGADIPCPQVTMGKGEREVG